jgi:tape measure domain-containing protein
MANQISGLTVKFDADITALTSAVSQVKAQINSLTSATKSATSGITSGASQAKNQMQSLAAAARSSSTTLASSFKNAATGLLDIGSKVGMAVFGFKSLAEGALSLGQSLLAPALNAEQTKIAFTSLLGSGQAATKMMQTLGNIAVKTPFELPQVQAAAQQLLAFKFAGADVPNMLLRIGDAVSSVGGGADAMQGVIIALGQMKLKGKVAGDEMLQLTERNIDAWGYVAKALGVTTAQAQAMASKGLIPADTAIKAIISGMGEFKGAMDKQSASALGLASTLKDAFNINILASFGQGVLTPLKGVMSDLIAMLSNPAFQTFATQLGVMVGQAIVNVVNGFKQMIATGQQIIVFFQQNTTALQALQVVAMMVGGILVAAFSAWAISAAAAAAATIAATWPILAIGAAIGLLAAGFIALYTGNAQFKAFIDGLVAGLQAAWSFITANFMPMWGQLVALLAQVGAWLASVFAPVWTQLVTLWQSQMLPALQQLWAALQPLGPALQVIGTVILGVVVVALVLFVALLAGLIAGLAGLLQGLTLVITGIVQIISGFLQIVMAQIQLFTDLFTGQWQKLGADLLAVWQGVATMFTGIWNVILGVVQGVIGAIVGLVGGFITTIISFFTNLYQTLVGGSIVPDMVNAILNWFRQLGPNLISIVLSMVTSAINAFNNFKTQAVNAAMNIVNGIKNAFSGLATAASGWITDMGNNIVSGLNAIVGKVGAAAQNVAGAVSKSLAHSVPKVGPLRHELTWMPHLGDNLARGLRAQIPKVSEASVDVASSIARPNYASLVSPTSGEYAAAGSATSSGDLTVIYQVDGYEMARTVMPHVKGTVFLKQGLKAL